MTIRFMDLLKRLHDHGVEFVMIGGVAATLLRAPVSTLDYAGRQKDQLALVHLLAIKRNRDGGGHGAQSSFES